MPGPFAGLLVLDLGIVYNGPYCGLLLAQLGARVVKIEPLDGEGLRWRSGRSRESHEFIMLNSNKESIAVDLKTPEGVELLRSLAEQADVLIENFAPGVMTRLGLDPDDLVRKNPRLIVASGKGYGSSGPYKDMAAMDLTIQAMSGVVASTGFPEGPPVKAGPGIADFLGGTHLFAGIAAALYQREKTGRGQRVEVSMHDAIYPTLASPLAAMYDAPAGTVPPERTGNKHSGLSVCPYNIYEAADGQVAIICSNDRHWARLAEAIGAPELLAPELSTNTGRVDQMSLVDEIISRWMLGQKKWEAVNRLHGVGVPAAPVLTVREVSEDEHLHGRGMIQTVEHHSGRAVPVPGCAIRLSDGRAPSLRAAPSVGEHTRHVLTDLLGLEKQAVSDMVRSGIVAETRASNSGPLETTEHETPGD